jgi:hypothetical protein
MRALTALTLLLIPVEDNRRLQQAHPDLAMACLRDFAGVDHPPTWWKTLSLARCEGGCALLLEQSDSARSLRMDAG